MPSSSRRPEVLWETAASPWGHCGYSQPAPPQQATSSGSAVLTKRYQRYPKSLAQNRKSLIATQPSITTKHPSKNPRIPATGGLAPTAITLSVTMNPITVPTMAAAAAGTPHISGTRSSSLVRTPFFAQPDLRFSGWAPQFVTRNIIRIADPRFRTGILKIRWLETTFCAVSLSSPSDRS